MPTLDDWITLGTTALNHAGNNLVINQWLARRDVDAWTAIAQFIDSSPTPCIDSMDETFMVRCRVEIHLENRTRLIQFYAMFKMLEYIRFQTFRGFPPQPFS